MDSDDSDVPTGPTRAKGKGRAVLSSDSESDIDNGGRNQLPPGRAQTNGPKVAFNAQSKAKGQAIISGLNDRSAAKNFDQLQNRHGEDEPGRGDSRMGTPGAGAVAETSAAAAAPAPMEIDFEEEDDLDITGIDAQTAAKKRKTGDQSYAWEASYNRSWDAVQEDESGGLQAAVEGLMMRGRRRRAQTSQSSLRRSIIRHMYILLDLSISMNDKDMRPTRWDLTLQYLRGFVMEWFDQNPLGQIGIIGLRNGLGEMIIEMGGNPHAILAAIADKRTLEPSGEPSLQNGLDMARSSMNHLPSTSSLEVLILFSSLTTTDPGSIHKTLSRLLAARIRVSIIALAAELKICRLITEKTHGKFGVALNEAHYRELLFEMVQAPATTMQGTIGLKSAMEGVAKRTGSSGTSANGKAPPADLMMMGFPTRLPLAGPGAVGLCACHGLVRRGGYLCPRCGAKACEVPTDCEVCGLMVVSSPHLARSYWFLFPVPAYTTIPDVDMANEDQIACFGCDVPFPESTAEEEGVSRVDDNVSATGRYQCPNCRHDYCVDCDLFIHEILKSCPGCASKT